VPGHFPTTRNLWSLLRNSWLAARVMVSVVPDVVVSTGAGIAVPFVVLARALGVPTVFIEVVDRIESRTVTGKLCGPWTDLYLVQWPRQQLQYRRSLVLGSLWRGGGASPMPAASEGAIVVVVAVGSDHHPFDRLFDWVGRYVDDAGDDLDIRLVCQHGAARPPEVGESSAWFPQDELHELMAAASVVIVHGGPYSILESIRCGRRPIVVPREQRFGEAVDDHQVAFCEILTQSGEVVGVRDETRFRAALDAAIADPESLLVTRDDDADEAGAVVERFGTLVGGLRPARRRRLLERGTRTARRMQLL
jgi:UDP-N-acetylglucosamine transferase subunit ALG13